MHLLDLIPHGVPATKRQLYLTALVLGVMAGSAWTKQTMDQQATYVDVQDIKAAIKDLPSMRTQLAQEARIMASSKDFRKEVENSLGRIERNLTRFSEKLQVPIENPP